MTTAVEHFSTFLRSPNEVISKLDEGNDVVLTRRGAASLRLSRAQDAEVEAETLGALTQLVSASLDDETIGRIAGRLSEPFPWIEFLPLQHRRDFVEEFLRVARACASVGRFDRLTIALHAWKATAEAYADPHVTSDGTDLDYLDEPVPVADPRRDA